MVGKISEMTAAATLTGAEQVEVVQSGATRRTTTGAIAALTVQKYRGLYVSLAALNAAVPTGSAGDYADVDSGTGSNVKRYIWDTSDTAWVEQAGGGAGMVNPMTTAGDLIVGGAAGVPSRLPAGATGKVLGVAAGSPAWVDPPASGTSLPVVRSITANETLGLSSINTFGVNSTVSNYTSTIPAQATVAWTADAELHFLPSNTGDITITAATGVTLNGVVAGSLTLSTQNGAASLKRTGTDAWWLGGVIGTAAEQRTALGLGNISGINRLINGAFQINQRAVSGTVTLAAGAYGHDRWKAGASGCTYTFATAANVTTITITAGSLQQVIEGVNLQSGTHTLSWSGTAQGKIGAGSYGASGVTGSAVGGTNLTVEFNTGTLSLAQLEAGPVATPFEHRQHSTERMLCARYCYKATDTFSLAGPTNASTHSFAFPVEMRVIPSVTHGYLDSNFVTSPSLAAGQWGAQLAGLSVVSKASGSITAAFTGITTRGATLYMAGMVWSLQANWVTTNNDGTLAPIFFAEL